MISMPNQLLILLLLAAPATAAAQPDPWAALPTLQFGGANSLQPIIDEVGQAHPADYPRIEARLLRAARDPKATFACKRFVADMLRIVGSRACLPVVLKWLEDPQTASLATFAIGGLQGDQIDAALIDAMDRQADPVRAQLIPSLAGRRISRIVPSLARDAASPDLDLARASIRGLGTIASPESAAALRALSPSEALAIDRELALLACADQLIDGGSPEVAKTIFADLRATSPRPNVVAAAIIGLVRADPRGATPAVLAGLKDTRRPVALRAARASIGLEGASVTGDLAALLPALPPPVQVALIHALAERGDRAAYPAVKLFLESTDDSLRAAAAHASQALADESAVRPLLAMAAAGGATGDSPREMLARMKQPAIDQELQACLSGERPELVRAAASILALRGCRDAMPRLLKLADHPDPSIRDSVLRAIEKLAGPDDLAALIELLSRAGADDRERIAQAAWSAVRTMEPKESRFPRIWNAAPPDLAVRAVLVPLASRCGGEESLRIVDALARRPGELQDSATRAIFNWPDDAAAPAVLNILKTTGNATYRALGARALSNRLADPRGSLGVEERRRILLEAVDKADRPEDKQALRWALDKLAPAAPKP